MPKPFNPAYGLPDAVRINALRLAVAQGVPAAATICRVSRSALYRWRRAYSVAHLMGGK